MVSPIEKIVDSEINTMISDLKTLINIASVSAKDQNLVECAEAVFALMNRVGIKSEIIYLDPKDKNIAASSLPPPVVYGEIKSQKNPNGKTILFYNHYDVQPEDPLEIAGMFLLLVARFLEIIFMEEVHQMIKAN